MRMRVKLAGGEYEISTDSRGRFGVLRWGQPWRDGTAETVIFLLVGEVLELQEQLKVRTEPELLTPTEKGLLSELRQKRTEVEGLKGKLRSLSLELLVALGQEQGDYK